MKSRWGEHETGRHAERLEVIAHLLALRKRHLVPLLRGLTGARHWRYDGDIARVEWDLADGARWSLLFNFGTTEAHSTWAPVG